MATTSSRTTPGDRETKMGADGSVPADLERALTQVARAVIHLGIPRHALAEGESIDKAGYWLLMRVSETGPVRLSDLAEAVGLDPSTVSRQMGALVNGGLITKEPDPHDGRASFLSLSGRGASVLESVSVARRQALADALTDWSDDERATLATGLFRLATGLQHSAKATR